MFVWTTGHRTEIKDSPILNSTYMAILYYNDVKIKIDIGTRSERNRGDKLNIFTEL